MISIDVDWCWCINLSQVFKHFVDLDVKIQFSHQLIVSYMEYSLLCVCVSSWEMKFSYHDFLMKFACFRIILWEFFVFSILWWICPFFFFSMIIWQMIWWFFLQRLKNWFSQHLIVEILCIFPILYFHFRIYDEFFIIFGTKYLKYLGNSVQN